MPEKWARQSLECGADWELSYPLLRLEIFYLELFWASFPSNRVNPAQVARGF